MEESRRDRAAAPASPFFCDDLLEHLPIEAQIGNELLEFHVFFSKLPQLADLGRPEVAVFLFPEGERVFVDATFSDDIYDRRAGFSLAEGPGDLFCGMSFSRGQRLPKVRSDFAEISRVPPLQKSGLGSL